MDDFKDMFDAFNNLENLPEEQKKTLEEKLNIISGDENALHILKKSLKECNIDEKSFKEIYNEYKKAERINLLSTPEYFKWSVKYINKNQKLASYHVKKSDITENEKQNIKDLKIFYEGIDEYAKENNIHPYIVDNLIKRCYFIEYSGTILGITLYGFNNAIMCNIIDRKKFVEYNGVSIDFSDILKYYRDLQSDNSIQYGRK